MTETIISLLSISCGILGAVLFGKIYSKHSFGISGNAIVGVFGSILLIKSFGRLGFAPNYIVINQKISISLLLLNFFISALGGIGLLVLIKTLYKKSLSDKE